MANMYLHSFTCQNCSSLKEGWFPEGETVVCPVNPSHIIVSGSDSIIQVQEGGENTLVLPTDFKGRIRTVDTSRSDPYTWSYFTSAGDHVTNGIGEGTNFSCSLTTAASETIAVDFIEDVEMHYGICTFQNMTVQDRVSVWAHAPQTYVKEWDGVHPIRLIKVEVVPSSGMHVLVPHAQGTFMFDETNGKFPIPVESYGTIWEPTGFFDRVLNPSDYSSGGYTVNSNQQGQFNFYDFPIDLGWFVNNCRMVSKNNNSVTFGNEDAFRCYRGWQMKLMVENGDTARTADLALNIAVILKLNRKTIR